MDRARTIFYVEDDEHIRDLAAYALRQAGFDVRTFPDGAGFVEACAKDAPALILLDIMLPGTDGLTLLKALRAQPETAATPIMMLTAKGTEFDKVVGLDAGADDYLAKPFGMMELISRSKALLRRAQQPSVEGAHPSQADAGALTAGELELIPAERRVTAAGREVELTRKEFDLLRCLMQNKGIVLSREHLLDEVWGTSFVGKTRTVDMHVKTLRKKISHASPGSGTVIETVRGSGYRLRKGGR